MKLLKFNIANHDYTLNITQICDVLRFRKVQDMPNTADWYMGIINHQQRIIPVIHLEKYFHGQQHSQELNETNRIIVTQTSTQQLTGLLVDRAESVISVPEKDIEVWEPQPGRPNYLTGAFMENGKLIVLMDVDKLIANDIHEEVAKNGQANACNA